MLEGIANATWRNPIFMLVFFGVIWYVPGLILRRLNEEKMKKLKEKKQKEAIERLYPKE